MRVADTAAKRVLWALFLLFVVVAGVLFVGARYFNNFNDVFAASPNCKHDCWEDGKRVR